MMVGHALGAFAVAAGLAALRGWDGDRAIALGAVAAGFAAVPDVDIAYALVGVARTGLGDVWATADAFWSTGNEVHRAVTHSLVVGAPTAFAAILWSAERTGDGTPRPRHDARNRLAATVTLVALVAGVFLVDGVVGALVMALFSLAALGVSIAAARRTSLSVRALGVAALFGLLSHPFGDLFTGEPPAFGYPLDVTLVAERVALHPDPTLNLLAVFGLELAVAWLAAVAYLRLRSRTVRAAVDRRCALGAVYGLAALLIAPPTLSVSYHFVFTVLAVGLVGVVRTDAVSRPPVAVPVRSWLRCDRWQASRSSLVEPAVTGLATVTAATLAYALAYAAV